MKPLFSFLLVITMSWATAQDIVFNNLYDYGTNETSTKIIQSGNGYFLASGGSFSGTYKIIAARLDFFGNKLNHSIIEEFSLGSAIGYGTSIGTNNNLFYLTGWFNDSSKSFPFIHVIDSNYGTIWKDTIMLWSVIHSLAFNPSDSAIVCSGYRVINNDEQFFLLKYSHSGDRLIIKSLGSATKNEVAYSISQTPDGGYVLSGYRDQGNGDSNPYVVKTDSNGNFLWEKEFMLTDGTEPAAFNTVDKTGNIYLGAAKRYAKLNNGIEFFNSWMAKLKDDGTIIWEKSFSDGSLANSPVGLVQRRNGNLLLLAQSQRDSVDRFLARIYEVDTAGNLLKNIVVEYNPDLNPNGFDYPRSIDTTADNGFIIAGFATQLPTGQDLWVVKFDSNGCYDYSNNSCTVGIEEYSYPSFQFSVWPNPASGLLHIETDSPILEIEVYSQTGCLAFRYQLSDVSS